MQKSLPVAGLKLYFSLTKSTHPSAQLPSLLHSWLAFIGYFLFDNAIKNGKTTLYYDVKTGLKVLTSTTTERAGQKMTSTITYSDYKDVKGVKVPYKVVMSQGRDIEIKVTDVKINEGVTDADFQ